MSCNFGCRGEVTPCTILTKCGTWADMVDVITCPIFGDCRLWGVSLLRGVILPSAIDLRCDRVIWGCGTCKGTLQERSVNRAVS